MSVVHSRLPDISNIITKVTGIDDEPLAGPSVKRTRIVRRMSCASQRILVDLNTTYIDFSAFFGIYMLTGISSLQEITVV